MFALVDRRRSYARVAEAEIADRQAADEDELLDAQVGEQVSGCDTVLPECVERGRLARISQTKGCIGAEKLG